MPQKDSPSKDLPRDHGHSTCFWNFHIYSGSQHSCCDCWHSHDICHSHTCSRFDPPSRFWVGKSSDFPQERIISIAEKVGYPELQMQPDTIPIGSSVIRGLCSWQKKGSQVRDFTKTNILVWLGKTLHRFKRRQAPNFSSLHQPKWYDPLLTSSGKQMSITVQWLLFIVGMMSQSFNFSPVLH